MATNVLILGPLEVVADGTRLKLGGKTQRALLALLALHAGELVPRERLHSILWPEADGEAASRNLKSYVYSLRKALGPASALVETRPGGYRLDVAPECVDAGRFERQAAEGRRALQAGEPERAAAILREALALWRGDVLADLAGEPFVTAVATQLSVMRLEALENRVEADLARGRHAELVGELQALVAREPLRERLVGELMLSLYRSGRQADALDAFARARAALDELGLEPSRELRDLQAAILRHEPSLGAESRPQRPESRLPAPATPLLGRETELAEITSLFVDEGARLVTLTGPGGVGKSRLALQVAERLSAGFEAGAVFVALGPLRDAKLVATAIADALGADERAGATPLEAAAAHVSGRQILIVLDNFEHVQDAAPELADLLAAAPRASLLVTSRTWLSLYGEFEYRVRPLRLEEEAVPLFRARARSRGTVLTDADAPAIAELCRRLDCLPLAIELVAARSSRLPLEQLAVTTGMLDLASDGPRDVPARHQALRETIAWSHDLLSADAQRLFRRLAVFAGGCSEASARDVCGGEDAEIDALVAANIVTETASAAGERRLSMLELIRGFAWERLSEAGEANTIAQRHAEHYCALAEHAEAALLSGADRADWLDRLGTEHDNLRAALAWARARDPGLALRLSAAMRLFWELRGHLREGREALAGALASSGREPADVRAKALNAAAVMAYRQGDLEEAQRLIDASLVLFRELGDDYGAARALGELGNVASESGDHVRAVVLYEECADMLRELGNLPGVATVLANIGDVALKEGDLDRADRLLEEAVVLQRQVGDRDGVASTLFTLGRVAVCRGDGASASRFLGESMGIALEIGYPECVGYCLACLAEIALAAGAAEEATRLLAAAGATFERIGAAMQQLERDAFDEAVSEAAHRLGRQEFEQAWAAGRALDLEQAVVEAHTVSSPNG